MRDASDPFAYNDTQFKDLYRLDKIMVQYVAAQLTRHMPQSNHPDAIAQVLRIFAALFFSQMDCIV